MAIKLILGEAEIRKAIASLNMRAAAIGEFAHRCACSVLVHVAKHGNTNVVKHLLENIPTSMRVNSLAKWFEAYGPVKVETLKGEWVVTWEKGKQTNLAKAMATPFWKFRAGEGVAYAPLDVTAEVTRLIRKLEKDTTDSMTKTGVAVDHGKEIATLRTLIRKEEEAKAA